ncbi:MAG: hypothetical protein JSW39_02925 [Desulfobacterales bacterium]|nr:MAG: hypothetical protein JSW39_02925 [Desulfobacterales bacterium]
MCRQQVAELAQSASAFEERHIRLVVIGNGKPQHMQAFRQKTGYTGLLYTDPSLQAYRAMGFIHDAASLIGFKSITQGFRALKDGRLPGGLQGSALQLGGALVVGPGDTLYYYYGSRQAGDHPPLDEMLRACTA